MDQTSIKKILFGNKSIRERITNCILPGLAITFTLLFFGPMCQLYNARNYLNCPITTVFPLISLVFFLSFLLLTVFLSLLSGDIHVPLISLIVGITIGCFIQGTYLNPDFGLLDGSEIVWSDYKKSGLINMLIWLIIIAFPFVIYHFSKEYWSFFCNFVSIMIIIILAVSLSISIIPQMINEKQENLETKTVLSKEEAFVFGSKENVLFICLDMVETNYLTFQTLDKYPDILEPLHDFTWFDNYNSRYYGTFPSVTYFLTHTDYDSANEMVSEYAARAWSSDDAVTFYSGLQQAGYKTNVYMTEWSLINLSNLKGKVSNAVSIDAKSFRFKKSSLKHLYFLSVFYHCPTLFKAPFHCDTDDIAEIILFDDNHSFWDPSDAIRDFWEKGAAAGDYEKLFSYYHFEGGHSPYKLNCYGKPEGATYSRSETIAGHFRFIAELFQYMKDLEIYDSSLIIISSDHGFEVNQQPILFIKKPGEKRAEIAYNHAPVSQENLYPTIAEIVGFDSEKYGKTVYEIPEDLKIERCTKKREFDPSYPYTNPNGDNVMTEYCYTGDQEALEKVFVTRDNIRIFEMIDNLY